MGQNPEERALERKRDKEGKYSEVVHNDENLIYISVAPIDQNGQFIGDPPTPNKPKHSRSLSTRHDNLRSKYYLKNFEYDMEQIYDLNADLLELEQEPSRHKAQRSLNFSNRYKEMLEAYGVRPTKKKRDSQSSRCTGEVRYSRSARSSHQVSIGDFEDGSFLERMSEYYGPPAQRGIPNFSTPEKKRDSHSSRSTEEVRFSHGTHSTEGNVSNDSEDTRRFSLRMRDSIQHTSGAHRAGSTEQGNESRNTRRRLRSVVPQSFLDNGDLIWED